jgi:hypothetical protein
MDATQNLLQQTEAVGQVIEQVVRSMTVPETASKTAIDKLTKAFETFSVNLLQQVQS